MLSRSRLLQALLAFAPLALVIACEQPKDIDHDAEVAEGLQDGEAREPQGGDARDPSDAAAGGMDATVSTNATSLSDAGARREAGQEGPCAPEVILEPIPSHVMLSVERSLMETLPWAETRSALAQIVDGGAAQVGAHVYSADLAGLDAGALENLCGKPTHQRAALAADAGQAVLAWLDQQVPSSQSFYSFRPVIDALSYFSAAEPFPQADAPKYLVLATEGSDNCFGSSFAADEAKQLLIKKLARDLHGRDIRLLPIILGTEQAPMFRMLDELAREGLLDKVHAVRSSAELATAARAVAGLTRSCRYRVQGASEGAGTLTVTLADQAIERDRARKGGWDFVDPAHRFIELFGAACASARNGALARARRSDCACTRTLAEIETHKRSLLLLIQASSALSTCSSQQQELCVQGNGQSWWQVMGNSLARALTDSAFDELEFGLRLYPSVQTQCSVAATPEVLPSKDAEVPALRALLGLPGGSAALLAGMEQVARETEPASAGEERILLVIGNGNDGCSGLASSELTARLSAAADRLAQAGVRIYPVLVAQGSDLIAASDNLRAIARPPGLGALGADAGVPYLDGADPNALPKLLGRVVHELDTCSLRLSTLKPEHDRKLVRLFLAGEALERDETQKNQGWGWKNAAAGEIDLYGEACRRFKELGVAQITAEIGC